MPWKWALLLFLSPYILFAVLMLLSGCVVVHVDNSPQTVVTITVNAMATVPVSGLPGGLP
jgi:hypothetical protein